MRAAPPTTFEVRRIEAQDYDRVADLREEAFRRPMRLGPWSRREGFVLVEHGQVEAVLLAEPMGQYFGGRSVPTAAVSSVIVDTRMRGRGFSTALLRETFVELRRSGAAISVLYPSIVGTYRRVGYELAGARIEYRTRVDSLPALGNASRVEPWDEAQLDEVIRCYQQVARRNTGMFDRTLAWWHDRVVVQTDGQRLYRHLVRRDGEVTGYVIYTQEPALETHGLGFSVVCRELVWFDADAANALLAFLGQNRPLATDLHWFGPLHEPLANCLPYVPIQVHDTLPIMLRLINVKVALEARGYPTALEASVELSIHDALLPDNNGAIRLSVRGGQACVEQIPAAAATVDAGTLAALYSGWLRAGDAVRLNRLTGAQPEAIEMLDLLFSGPPAWIPDWI